MVIFKKKKKNWIHVTQFEVYYRNNQVVDESAMVTTMDRYREGIAVKAKTKTEKGKSWYEVSAFLGRHGLLFTGGLTGCKISDDVVPFLGPNVPLKEFLDDDTYTTEVYLTNKDDEQEVRYQVRNLRNWTKKSSYSEWTCISSRFFRKSLLP